MYKPRTLPRWQRRIFAVCFVAYSVSYIGRVNLPMALPALQEAFGFTGAGAGAIGTTFYWVYATGQLVNGQIGDRMNSRGYIFVSLAGAALTNVLFGFARSLWLMIALWGMNGAFQSMLWGPLIKLLFSWFCPRRNKAIAFHLSATVIIGSLGAVALAGSLVKLKDWRYVFWASGIVIGLCALFWILAVRNHPRDVGLACPADDAPPDEISDGTITGEARVPTVKLILGSGLVFVALACVALGMVRDSLSLWGPKILMQAQGLKIGSTMLVMLIIPLINFSGIQLSRRLNKRWYGKEKFTSAALMAACAACALLLWLAGAGPAGIPLLAGCSMLAAGNNPLLTTLVPLRFARYGRVSGIAGFIDFFVYVGSGVSGILSGWFADTFGWQSVYLYWAVASLAGAACMIYVHLRDWRYG